MDSQRNFFLILFLIACAALWFNWNGYQLKKLKPEAPIVSTTTEGSQSAEGKVQIPLGSQQQAGQQADVATPSPNVPKPVDQDKWVEVNTPLYSAWFSPEGMNLVKVVLKKHRADDGKGEYVFMDASGKYQYSARSGLIAVNQSAPNHLSAFTFEKDAYSLSESEKSLNVTGYTVDTESGIRVTKTWTFYPDRYDIELTQKVANESDKDITVQPYYLLTHNDQPPEGSNFTYSSFQGPAYYTQERKYEKVSWDDIVEDEALNRFSDNNGWMAMVQHYFVGAWVLPKDTKRDFFIHAESQPHLFSGGLVGQAVNIAAGKEDTTNAALYAGPQDQDELAELSEGLDLVVDYGLLTVIAKPLFILMQWIHSVVGNWGWTIVFLTMIVKTIFFPLSAASYRSMARMRKLTPKMTQVREMYADNKQMQQQEMIKLYKTEKVNPLGGCLPIFVQIPVFIALYWVLLGSVEMRSAPWIGWIDDLAKPDPYYILPAIMAVSMFVQTKLNPPPPDPMQAKLMTIMPIAFSVFFFFFPAGLVLYWVVNNILSIAQQQYNNKKYA